MQQISHKRGGEGRGGRGRRWGEKREKERGRCVSHVAAGDNVTAGTESLKTG